MRMLRQEIEKQRRRINSLAQKYGLTDDRVLMKSRELDRLLNQFQREKSSRVSC